MADNTTITPGTGATVAADDIGGALYQRVKVAHGADGSATDTSAAAPLPVTDALGATAAHQVTQNGYLDNVETLLTTIDGRVDGLEGLQTTANGYLDGVEGLLTTIDADTGALAGAVSGNEVQVDVVGALPAGDNNIGNVDLASAIPAGTNNIGDVDVLSVALPTTIYAGQKTVTTATTQEALASSQAILSGVTVKALHGNTGWIYVGDSNVSSTTGIVLDAGESVFIEVANLATVYIDSSVNGEGVSYIAT